MTSIFYLVQIVFILLVSIFANTPFFYTVFFNDIFCVNKITNIFDNNSFIKGLLNRDNKFLYCNCKVTGDSVTLFQQENKFRVYKTLITSKNNSDFLIQLTPVNSNLQGTKKISST